MDKFNEFIELAKKLNEIEMIPLLMGSVGLEVITEISWGAQDLDVHVRGDKHNGCLMWHLIPPCKFT
ncbi:hypothetical protein [Peribacillus muralis]|uniref:hypothetical protein n=1 Tax=Peribacillus muralis TaxID=264697 RepID=UPI00366DED0F